MVGENSELEGYKTSTKSLPQEEFYDNLKEVHWEWAVIDPNNVNLVPNIREIKEESVLELAMSIREVGQLQPCIGDVIQSENGQTVRLIAGQHRYYAIKYLCENDYPIGIVMRIANRTLTSEEVLSIQMSENLQNKMTPEEDAETIHSFWKMSEEVYGKGKVSISYLARKMGRSPRKVSDSIRYVEELSPKVQEMVNIGVLPYSTALLLAKMMNGNNNNGNNDFYSEQVRTAIFLISKNYTTSEAEKYLRKRAKEKEIAGPLFSGEIWKEIKSNGYNIAIKDQASKEGRAAIGWFVRMEKAVSNLEQPYRVKFSDAIKKAMLELGVSLEEFYSNLEQMGAKFE